MEPSPSLMHTIYAAPVCLSAPISHRCAPLFSILVDPSGQFIAEPSLTRSGVVREVTHIARSAHADRSRLATNALPDVPVSNRATLAAERPFLKLCRDEHRSAVTAAIEALDHRIMERGEMQEYPDLTGRGPTLFRYTGYDGVQSAFSVPPGRLTPHVRALLWELAEAIEDEGG